jgi:hypothetical protein
MIPAWRKLNWPTLRQWRDKLAVMRVGYGCRGVKEGGNAGAGDTLVQDHPRDVSLLPCACAKCTAAHALAPPLHPGPSLTAQGFSDTIARWVRPPTYAPVVGAL